MSDKELRELERRFSESGLDEDAEALATALLRTVPVRRLVEHLIAVTRHAVMLERAVYPRFSERERAVWVDMANRAPIVSGRDIVNWFNYEPDYLNVLTFGKSDE